MYLRKIELYGFKSFVERTSLDFGPGLAVVVGPNGSGKSNIADALRWVMGEQSIKSLRGSRLEDIIFAGSQKRRPLGMAEVSVTFDNSRGVLPLDFHEVTVTRRVFRSGESEFLINKIPCRLRDVQDLFADTGVGRDALYIIGQGRVEEVLSARPEERRALVEEAAGIIKYRNRKREAVRKLEETQGNLDRLNDLILELENQLEPLRRESLREERYRRMKLEMTTLELGVLVRNIQLLRERCLSATSLVQDKRTLLIEAETRETAIQAYFLERQIQIQQAEEQEAEVQKKFYELTTRLERLEGQVAVVSEQLTGLMDRQGRVEREADENRQRDQQISIEWQRVHEHHARLLEQVALAEREIAQMEADAKEIQELVRGHEASLEQAKRKLFDQRSELATCRTAQKQVMAQKQAALARWDRLSQRLEQLNNNKEIWEGDIASIISGIANCQEQIQSRKQIWQKGLDDLHKARQVLVEKRKSLEREYSHLEGLRSRREMAAEMIRQGEGLYEGVRAVVKAATEGKDGLTGVIGVVGNLLQVPETLETAMEVVLGAALQDVVTTTEWEAKQAIHYLKSHNLGRATFLPLDTIQPRQLPVTVARAMDDHQGILGRAADLVDCEPSLKPVLEFLLGNVVVAENLDAGASFGRRTAYTVRIVTLDGDVFHPGGSVSGGSTQKRRGGSILSRKREVEKLDETITSLARTISIRREELEREEQSLLAEEQRLAAQSDEIKNLAETVVEGEKELVKSQAALQHATTEIQQVEADLVDTGEELSRLVAEEQRLLARAETLALEVAEQERCLGGDQENQAELRENSALLASKITEARVALAAQVQKEIGARQDLERLAGSRRQVKTVLHQLEAELRDLAGAIAEKQNHLQEQRASLQEGLAEKALLENLVVECRRHLVALRTEQSGLDNSLKEVQRLVASLREELHQAEVYLARQEGELEAAQATLRETWKIDLEEAIRQAPEIHSIGSASQRIRQLQQEITELGEVQHGAMDECRRLEDRLGFLTRQLTDLQQARGSLLEVISEVDRVMAQRFRQAFDAVAQSFGRVFQELFGGGHAELQLTDPDNMLETGIEIIAQPPGKRLQYLGLMSGGERALTAIALLFALLDTRPSPFCILDEIEASLDEANVERFTRYLSKLKQHTQFILISHRQGTMEAADTLYGVTMEEPGVSKLVTVQLAELSGHPA